jgi:hypothetical protein
MKVKTNELSGNQLDWAVAKAIGEYKPVAVPEYSTNWAQGGPIIERERIAIWWAKWDDIDSALPVWSAVRFNEDDYYGPTPLIAAMRCYVASKLGEEVEVPKEEGDE